ncbi:DUF2778 domain-containing protein [Chimaeribacter arupi]|uniref:tlde1 domain-containing protein n=1 Tax=Chimaeribacter arupi TaxID=2060066 RepID=UPI002711EE38|nr:tlde1 domain-containing protein [Chimaeribacter arupi]WKZ93841.1 DUF2778 domain-containing protein [Chimaeribacter arupi]
MAWIYYQSSGKLYHNHEFVEKGYAGRMTNKNNPDRQQVKGLGPLPQGEYKIEGHTRSKGPMTIVLRQVSGETFGRGDFRIHGERKNGPAGWASEGCIIMKPSTRNRIINSNDNILVVMR